MMSRLLQLFAFLVVLVVQVASASEGSSSTSVIRDEVQAQQSQTAPNVDAVNVSNNNNHHKNRALQGVSDEPEIPPGFDIYLEDLEECYDPETDTYGPCDITRFPDCDAETQPSMICFNRRPRQDVWYEDIRMPRFFIDYSSVLCYPDFWQGCSSCNPGRLCISEQRCILDDDGYPCAKWY